MADLKELEGKIKYTYKDKSLLVEALTHSSYANETGRKRRACNERMEFLGDAVLSIISAEYFFHKYPDMDEGELSKIRSSYVCTEALSEFARSIGLDRYMIMGKGALLSNEMQNDSVLEDAFEAVIASIYLDSGMEAAKAFVLPFLSSDRSAVKEGFKDYKSLFQIIIQKNPDEVFQYKTVKEEGPDHAKVYTVNLYVNSNVVGQGVSTSKKGAEQAAAKQALELMGVEL